MKLLYLPNEYQLGDQVGPRAVFNSLLQEGRLTGLTIFSFLTEFRRLGTGKHVGLKLLELAEEFQPEIVLVQHVGTFPLAGSVFREIKKLSSLPTIVYHEADVYGEIFKRFTMPIKEIVAESDLVFTVGEGRYAEQFLKLGAKYVLYSPSTFDSVRFGTDWEPTFDREYDLILIGNRVIPRWPFVNRFGWGRLPGALDRERLVVKLGRTFGERFAVFGAGWDGFFGNHGPVPFSDQEKAVRKSWLSISWDHFPNVPCFFSNRLPITMVAGVGHLTNYHPGYEEIFRNGEHLIWAKSVHGLVRGAQEILEKGPARLIEFGLNGRAFAIKHLSTEAVFKYIIDCAETYRNTGFTGLPFFSREKVP